MWKMENNIRGCTGTGGADAGKNNYNPTGQTAYAAVPQPNFEWKGETPNKTQTLKELWKCDEMVVTLKQSGVDQKYKIYC